MITDYYQYNDNGEIVQIGSCPEDLIDIQGRPGVVTVAGTATMHSHFVNENGVLCDIDKRPSREHVLNRALGIWEDGRTLDRVKSLALDQVDSAAGYARLRYITSVPGQAETYAKKEQQARSWAAESFAGEPPSFIAAEAQALNVSAQSVALEVIGLADYWSNIKGPQIEATRRKWKVAIEAASDPSLIQGLVDAARAELDGL